MYGFELVKSQPLKSLLIFKILIFPDEAVPEDTKYTLKIEDVVRKTLLFTKIC